jgi:hypothetical protein
MDTIIKTKKLLNDLYVNTACLVKLYFRKCPSAIEHSFVSVQHLCVKYEKSEDYVEYNFFPKLLLIIGINIGDKVFMKTLASNRWQSFHENFVVNEVIRNDIITTCYNTTGWFA